MLLIFGSSSRHNADARISSAGILPLVLMFSSKYTQFTLLVRVVLEHYGIANLKGMKIIAYCKPITVNFYQEKGFKEVHKITLMEKML